MTNRRSRRELADASGTTILRLVVGVVMMAHGWAKLTNVDGWIEQVASLGISYPEVTGRIAIAGEFFGGMGLFLGLLTPVAALGVISVLVTAILRVHWGNGLMASNNGFEFPLVLIAAAFFYLLRGPGPFSLDALVLRLTGHRSEATPDEAEPGGPRAPHAAPRPGHQGA